MVDFVLERQTTSDVYCCVLKIYSNKIDEIFNYARFLKKPLKLEYFIACDENGNVLEEKNIDLSKDYEYQRFLEAKSRVLFEGFEGLTDVQSGFATTVKTIEDLIPYNLTLTPTSLKQIGIEK